MAVPDGMRELAAMQVLVFSVVTEQFVEVPERVEGWRGVDS